VWEGLFYAGTTNSLDKKSLVTPQGADHSTFRKTDPELLVYGYFKAIGKSEKVTISAAIFDLMNTSIARTVPTRFLNRQDGLARTVFTFPLSRFAAGVYRVELLVEDKPVWRSFVTITD